MIHAKHLVFDDSIAMMGSMNLDMRSLYLNYEVAMFLYSQREIETVSRWMASIMERSREFPAEEAGYLQTWAEDLSLLVSPLL
jgi:cardiolipin synthase